MYDNAFTNWLNSSHLTKNNLVYINQIYEKFLKDPNSVDISWQNFFNKLFIETNQKDQLSDISMQHNPTKNQLKQNSNLKIPYTQTDINNYDGIVNIKILQLINCFRSFGHQNATLDPLGLNKNKLKNNFLTLEHYKFTHKNLLQIFNTKIFGLHQSLMTIHNIYKFLNKIYCGSIGIEYMHILNITETTWIQNYFESNLHKFQLHDNEQKQFLKEIISSEELERYLGTQFPGVKRFSLEGGDVLIPMLKESIRYSVVQHNIQEIFFGMAHRGRLNVLINVLGKNPKDLFNEFLGNHQNHQVTITGSGDVKYHQGLYTSITVNDRIIKLLLLPNPSHLEIITPVVMGSTRSRLDQLLLQSSKLSNPNCYDILPIIMHGDASFTGQGVVQESFNMSNTYPYRIGGMVHIIINNQIGFTTSDVHNLRSTLHCTDIAKMIQAPICHVNADDVNSVIFVTRFALDFRNTFKRDVVINLICYRRHGHNESDDPSVTQPIIYKKIRNHPTITKIYSDFLIHTKSININDTKNIKCAYRTMLKTENCLLTTWQPIHTYPPSCYVGNTDIYNKDNNANIIDKEYLQKLALHVSKIPLCITMHDRVKKIYCDRMNMASGKRLFDWGGAEILAYATLLDQGYSIRLSGEDTARGTFFHRHAIIYDQNNGSTYTPLMHIHKKQGTFFIWDSVLSEESTLAFEYGYAQMTPKNTLVIWEAQFGDFANGAQVVIDQFISSSEQKWNQLCGLIILLPHGYEGQGPEHSSCRIERYLQLCAENNMKICIPSTPSQIYHILRQHANNNIRKPLIIISPKSLLRHPMVNSSIEELAYGSFKKIFTEISDNCILEQVQKVIICTGKIYYDLVNQRNQIKLYKIAIIRIEQLYPFPDFDIQNILKSYEHVKDFTWCQEEPKNQGAWYYIQHNFCNKFVDIKLNYVGRPESASTAVGYFSVHQKQQKKIIDEALQLNQ